LAHPKGGVHQLPLTHSAQAKGGFLGEAMHWPEARDPRKGLLSADRGLLHLATRQQKGVLLEAAPHLRTQPI
jgi:hypothetical protein